MDCRLISTQGSPHIYEAVHVVSVPTTLTVIHPECRMESAHISVRRVSSLHYHRRLEHHLECLFDLGGQYGKRTLRNVDRGDYVEAIAIGKSLSDFERVFAFIIGSL